LVIQLHIALSSPNFGIKVLQFSISFTGFIAIVASARCQQKTVVHCSNQYFIELINIACMLVTLQIIADWSILLLLL